MIIFIFIPSCCSMYYHKEKVCRLACSRFEDEFYSACHQPAVQLQFTLLQKVFQMIKLPNMFETIKLLFFNFCRRRQFQCRFLHYILLWTQWEWVHLVEQVLSFNLVPHMWKSVKNWLQESHFSEPMWNYNMISHNNFGRLLKLIPF